MSGETPLNFETLMSLPEMARTAFFASLTEEEAGALLKDWRFMARPKQIAPPGDWFSWLIMGGRGFGKTRVGAEWTRARARGLYQHTALVGADAEDVIKVMIHGESGIVACCHPNDRDAKGNISGVPEYNKSSKTLTWENGAVAHAFSAHDPESLRGPQFSGAWCDEIGKWRYGMDTWANLEMAARLGDDVRLVATTTPRPTALIRMLLKDRGTIVTRGSTMENTALSERWIKRTIGRYVGTRLGRQEIEGEFLEDVDGAYVTLDMYERARLDSSQWPAREALSRIVVGLDPSGASRASDEKSDEIGIVAAGIDHADPPNVYILEDATIRGGPADWAKAALATLNRWEGDCIVAETNYGGAMVLSTIRSQNQMAPVREVTASRGKHVRFEPVGLLYEQGRIRHLGDHAALGAQVCSFTPRGYEGPGSPDRADAEVWAVTELLGRRERRALMAFDGDADADVEEAQELTETFIGD